MAKGSDGTKFPSRPDASALESTNMASSTTTSVEYLFWPCWSVHFLTWMEPVTQMAEPFLKKRVMNSAVCLQATQLMKSVTCCPVPSLLDLVRLLTAMVKEMTEICDCVV